MHRPLELMLGKTRYGPEVDMWSVGCILAELLLGKALFTGKDEIDQIDRIIKVCGSPTEHNMPGCKKLKQWALLAGMPVLAACSWACMLPQHLRQPACLQCWAMTWWTCICASASTFALILTALSSRLVRPSHQCC